MMGFPLTRRRQRGLPVASANQSGFYVLEALLTMLLVTIGLMTLGQLIAVGAISTIENRYREVATRVAQQFMEEAKGMNFSQLKQLSQTPQPTPHDVYVRLQNAQIFIDQPPTLVGGAPTFAFPTAVTYTYVPGVSQVQDQIAISVDVGYTHRGITRHVTMTTEVLNNGR